MSFGTSQSGCRASCDSWFGLKSLGLRKKWSRNKSATYFLQSQLTFSDSTKAWLCSTSGLRCPTAGTGRSIERAREGFGIGSKGPQGKVEGWCVVCTSDTTDGIQFFSSALVNATLHAPNVCCQRAKTPTQCRNASLLSPRRN